MTANLVVQVCMEPKLVARRARARLGHRPARGAPAAASPCRCSTAHDRDVVRRFVKPVTTWNGPPTGRCSPCPASRSPRSAPGACLCWPQRRATCLHASSGSTSWGATTLCIGEVAEVGGRAEPRSCAWRTPACTTAAEAAPLRPRCAIAGRRPHRAGGSQVDAQRQDAVDQLGLGVADHGEVGKVSLGLFAKALSLGALDRRHAPRPHRLGPLAEAHDHLLGSKAQARGSA